MQNLKHSLWNFFQWDGPDRMPQPRPEYDTFRLPASLSRDFQTRFPKCTHLRLDMRLTYPCCMLDWTNCTAVEREPGKISGAWAFKGTRVPVKALFENLEDGASGQLTMQLFTNDKARLLASLAKYNWVRLF